MATDSIVSELEEMFQQSKNLRTQFEEKWYLCMSYYLGNQWVAYDGNRLYEPRMDARRIKLVDNRIQPAVRTEVAKLTKQRPVFVVAPRTDSDEDIDAAKWGERIADFQWPNLKMPTHLRSALLWSRVCGAGFLKATWDSTLGESMDLFVGPDQKPIFRPNGSPYKVSEVDSDLAETMGASIKRVSMGDIVAEAVSPFEIYQDPLCGDEGLANAEWIGQESVYSPEYCQRRWNFEAEADTDASPGVAEVRMGMSMGGIADQSDTIKRGKGVKVREVWIKPSSKYPDGKWVIWANQKIIQESDNPYPFLPYVMLRGIPVPGRFWPTSVAEQLISPQTELNKRAAQIAENAERIGNPAFLKSRQSNVEYNGLPGEEILYDETNPNSAPGYLVPPELPAYVQADIGRIENSFREISGQHDATQGTVPTGVTAASAINLLQEADDTRLGPDVYELEDALGQFGSMILYLTGRFYTDERTIRILGEEGGWDIQNFRGEMLRENYDVSVQAGSGLPKSKAAKQAAMTETLQILMQYGVQISQRDLRKFFEDYETGGLERFFGTLSTSETQVERENSQMAKGEALLPNSFDDHPFHVDAHQGYQRTWLYSQLPEKSRSIFEAHVAAHKQLVPPPPGAVAPPPAVPSEQLVPPPTGEIQ